MDSNSFNPIQYILNLFGGRGNQDPEAARNARIQQIAQAMKMGYGNTKPISQDTMISGGPATPGQNPPSNMFPGDLQQPNPSPLAAAQQVYQQSQSPQQGGDFKYLMGQHDYSSLAPQVQSALKGSPLEPYANEFIQAGNKHGIDPRVLITIANNESSLGKNYPTDTYNPFGYNARSAGMIKGKDGKMYVNTDQGLRNAGFTSLPMAIDRMTQRFSDHPVNPTGQGYANFRQNPTVPNLQAAYNASDAEKANYIKNAMAFVQQFKNQ